MKLYLKFIIFLLIVIICAVCLLLLKKNYNEKSQSYKDLKLEVISPTQYVIGEKTKLEFYIKNKQGQAIKEFSRKNGDRVSLILVDKILSTYNHYYPTMDANTGLFTQEEYFIPKEGMYRMFVEFATVNNSKETLIVDFETGFDGENGDLLKKTYIASHKLISTGNTADIDGYQITIKNEGKLSLIFEIRRNGNLIKNLENMRESTKLYIVRKDDLGIMNAEIYPKKIQDGVVSFNTNFVGLGIHKSYLEFKHEGKTHIAEFVFDVKEIVK